MKERALKELNVTQQYSQDIEKQIKDTELLITKTLGDLEVAKDDINQVKEFHFLRMESERESQIRAATEYKTEVEKQIEELNNKIAELKDSNLQVKIRIERSENFLKD